MSGLKLHTSNRLEHLAQELALLVRKPLTCPLQPELILVQSQGMARWLKLQLAEHNGICSNCEFPFPRAFSYSIFRAAATDLPLSPAYDPELLIWMLMKRLPGLLKKDAAPGRARPAMPPQFEPLATYLSGPADPRKLYQLSQRLANTFDQYLVFRPELIREWDQGKGSDWQAQLWREVSEPFRQQHPAALQAAFLEQVRNCFKGLPAGALPERISIFGISAVPPFYLDIFSALASQLEVNLFLLEPCRQFWGYISSVREQERTLQRAGKGAAETATLHLESGNRLLASLGQLGRDFLMLIQDLDADCAHDVLPRGSDLPHVGSDTEFESFADPGEETLLSCIQSDILNLRNRGTDECPRTVVSATDDSVQVHACHGPVRELEVLHDHILEWFNRDAQLAPRDILVMIPEIQEYAPFVHAVFGSPEDERLRIPFSVADRTPRTQSHLVQTFMAILELAGSRLGAGRVLAMLESAAVRRKFSLAETDLELIRRWVEQVRIRWGQDQQQRAALGLPQWSENTWRHGLDRLLLGYAMSGNEDQLFENILPYADMEGDAVEVLGELSQFVQTLFDSIKRLETPRRLDEWAQALQALLRTFFETGPDEAADLDALRTAFEKLTAARERAGYDELVPLGVMLEQLNRDLAEDSFGAGYLTGGVTFCALKPMRSIPAKVICLLGMNDAAFPRSTAQLSFDLMAQNPRRGDRSSRQDDRYLFLETLISARQRLYISYQGRSIKDNAAAPPSVVVSELLDYIGSGFELPRKHVIEDLVLTRHRLQAFSPAYFRPGRLFSFSRENLQASRTLRPERRNPAELISKPLPEPEPEWRRLNLQALAEFFCHPAKFLATRRLNLRLPGDQEALEEREPFELAGLDQYRLQDELLESRIKGGNAFGLEPIVRASGLLPAGVAGSAHYLQASCEVEAFYQRLSRHQPEAVAAATATQLEIGPFKLTATFSHVTPAGLLFYRPASVKAKDLLRAWLEHLAWNAAVAGGNTILVGTTSSWTLGAAAKPLALLQSLLELYWRGLSQPLKFFPASSFAFTQVEQELNTGNSRKRKLPRDCALEQWIGNDFNLTGEGQDDYNSLFFREPPLDKDFEANSRAVFGPLLACAREERL